MRTMTRKGRSLVISFRPYESSGMKANKNLETALDSISFW